MGNFTKILIIYLILTEFPLWRFKLLISFNVKTLLSVCIIGMVNRYVGWLYLRVKLNI